MVPTACIHTVLAHSSIHDYTHTHTQRPTQLASPGSDLRLPRVQLRFRRVVRTVCTASACHVLECRNLPGPFKALGHTVCARWLTASVGEPGVPNRVKLGTVKVMLLVVNPARTAGLLFIVFPIRVPVAVVRQKKKTYTSNIPVNANHATPFGITNVLHIAPVFGKAAVLDMIDSAR